MTLLEEKTQRGTKRTFKEPKSITLLGATVTIKPRSYKGKKLPAQGCLLNMNIEKESKYFEQRLFLTG